MTRNPLFNAAAAVAYISILASAAYYVPKGSGEDSVAAPIAVLSLFVFSAAMMGYLLLSAPIILFLENKKSEAISLFVKTLLIFGLITAAFLAVLFLPALIGA
jgi:uncharacterized membrane protein